MRPNVVIPMGKRGPVGKRSDAVMGHRTKAELAERAGDQAPGAEVVEIPDADPEWHPIARDWYESLAVSGQHRFYEPSDWAVARYVAEGMSRHLNSATFGAQMMATVMHAASELLSTEGSRRRLRLELQRSEPQQTESPGVTAIEDYKRRLQA